ncbi:MAG: alanine:cation symporter family protein, partial [Acutalibacteraceae bacterium]
VGIYIFITNITRVPAMFEMIFKDAFSFDSFFGGLTGSVILLGVKRGLLSTEAGMGSAPNSAAAAVTSHPMKQGIMQIMSVGIDSMLICSTSAFIILLSKWDLMPNMPGIPLMQLAVSSQVGTWGAYFIGFSVICFSFSAIIGNFGISEPNILYIKNSKKVVKILRIVCLSAVLCGCVVKADLVWNLADIAMAGLAVLNLIVIFILRDKFMVCFKDYLKQRAEGKDPAFKAEDCGIYDATEWK